jgi:DNA-directed RNA polymerase subunit M/transcription elongation factor TFIIS
MEHCANCGELLPAEEISDNDLCPECEYDTAFKMNALNPFNPDFISSLPNPIENE